MRIAQINLSSISFLRLRPLATAPTGATALIEVEATYLLPLARAVTLSPSPLDMGLAESGFPTEALQGTRTSPAMAERLAAAKRGGHETQL